jgi:hypothetical protein
LHTDTNLRLLIYYLWEGIAITQAVIVCFLAYQKGGKPEKYGANILLSTWFLGFGSHLFYNPKVQPFYLPYALMEVFIFVLFCTIAFRWRRIWVVFIMAFQLNAIIAHFTMLFTPTISNFAYLTSVEFWSIYAVTWALGFGVWEHQKHLKLGLNVG